MIYSSASDWLNAPRKRVLLFGMSGLGKTHISNLLRDSGDWFHYSVDYRIGTRYMGEHIVDNFKAEAMRNPFLAQLLRTDSIYIASNITFENLAPLSTYLGKPGNAELGGLTLEEYQRRQGLHNSAEINSLLDTPHFIDRAKSLYGYDNFVCDTGGSICEVVDPEDVNDPVLTALSQNTLMVWIKGTDKHTDALIERFDRAPKPMYYQKEFLVDTWSKYLIEFNVKEQEVDPDAFVRFAFSKAMAHRQPLYQSMADNWGVTIAAEDIGKVTTPEDFNSLIAATLEDR
ncbi:MAG: ATPase [Pseudoruegeria sp.]